ncbi:MAG: hypothetical protein QOC80_1569 [Frankiaceae bacterium]|jgi:hypothetical protein|nr:hypothetical protein [Frankiaceae bacterium]
MNETHISDDQPTDTDVTDLDSTDPESTELDSTDPESTEPGDAGMSTAEYAIGTVAACGFAGVLWTVVHSAAVAHLMQGVVERALSLGT